MSKKRTPTKGAMPTAQITPADINKANREFWEDKADEQREILESKHGKEILNASAKVINLQVYSRTTAHETINFGVVLADQVEKYDGRLGRLFTNGRKSGTGGPIRKAVAKLLKANPDLKNPELWIAVAAKPPKGWGAFDNRAGKYFEGAMPKEGMNYERFCNVCGEERKKITG